MSRSAGKASEKEPDEAQSDSVYDFLYHDSRRIGSFLSQFDNNGLLTELTQGETASKKAKRGYKVGLGANLPVLGGGNVDFERGPGESGSECLERVYDPLWANALAFLDCLEGAGLIQRAIDRARIGQFVLVNGLLAVMDLTLFKGIWQMPAIKAAILAGTNINPQLDSKTPPQNRQQRRASAKGSIDTAQTKLATDNLNAGMDLIGLLPHLIQARLSVEGTDQTVWTSLKEDALIVSAADLTLKHGLAIAGAWNILGILDALPDETTSGTITESGSDFMARSAALADGPFGVMMNEMLPFLRPMLGRPFSAYGMTPLLIFRQVSG